MVLKETWNLNLQQWSLLKLMDLIPMTHEKQLVSLGINTLCGHFDKRSALMSEDVVRIHSWYKGTAVRRSIKQKWGQ